MSDLSALSRRRLLHLGVAAGCSAAAAPLMTRVTLASVPGDNRLVVIILRGAMDGVDAVRPVGDPDFAVLRGASADAGPAGPELDGFFALHPGLENLMPMWRDGSLAFAHAVATPYRNKRSHFDGQDILEAGSGGDAAEPGYRDGWLNRLIQVLPGATGETAFAVGLDQLKVLSGPAPVRQWNPDTRIDLDAQSRRLLEYIYQDDPLFHSAGTQAFDLARTTANNNLADKAQTADAPRRLALFTAGRLREDARIAAFSINGWDTHRNQRAVLTGRLKTLANTLVALQDGLGPDIWARTTVLAMTEFGRTVRLNGTGGTDHGTGGAMVVAGGAVRGGRVFGTWPGLGESALYQGRDLLPTADVRAHAAWAMRGLFGLDRTRLETNVFPGLDMGSDPGIVL